MNDKSQERAITLLDVGAKVALVTGGRRGLGLAVAEGRLGLTPIRDVADIIVTECWATMQGHRI